MPTAAIALGSNLGDRDRTLRGALAAISTLPDSTLVAVSSFHNTAPVGPIAQGDFLNAAAAIETALPARTLLARLHDIEKAFGRDRTREQRWGPRTLDLDLLLYGREAFEEAELQVPHPRMAQRLFVLAPLAEILPLTVIPGDVTVAEALQRLLRTITPE